tara:strand:- start:1270 stop:1770 length:501 start_codon:yes stop_codon:yes gene_type:complete
MFRSGIGIDTHKLIEGGPIKIGGVDIPSDFHSDGHSDGDALIHSIVDSILGALSLGDIGSYFPSSDNKYKDADSFYFLNETIKLMFKKKYAIANIDSVITLQRPLIINYIKNIKENISKKINISNDIISIKATTTDNLGYIGSSKGWSVTTIVMLQRVNEINSTKI